MPITPFHFGPGALLHSLAPRQVSFVGFCAANVLIDVESLYNLIHRREQVHAFFHTYVGATLAAAATVALVFVLLRLGSLLRVPNFWRWRELTLRKLAIGALLGSYSHVALDSVMHHDIRPLSPLSESNALLGILSLSTLHWFCIAAGALGVVILGVRKLLAPGQSAG